MEKSVGIRPLTLEDAKGIWQRRRWWFLGTSSLVAAIAFLGVGLWPSAYRSKALILIDQPGVSQDVVKPIVAIDSDQVISGLIQRVLSRTMLSRLDYFRKNGLSSEKDLDDFRDSVSIAALRDTTDPRRPAGKPYGLTVSFLGTSRGQAQSITNDLASLVVEVASKMTLEQAENTTNALRGQLQLAIAKVNEKGEALAQFRKQHPGQLPIDEQITVQRLSHLHAEMELNTQAIELARQNIADVESASQAATATQDKATEEESTVQDPARVRLETDLQTLKDRLVYLQSRYKPVHPDIIKTREQISLLEAELVAAQASTASAKTDKARRTPPKVAASNSGRERKNQVELAARAQERSELQSQISRYQSNLAAIPLRQEQYAEMLREYDAAKKDYETLRDQVSDAEHSTDVYQRQKLVRFRIQDYASLPTTPELPIRWKLNLGGLGLALALGLVLVGILELRDTSVKCEPDVTFYFGLPFLGMLPDFPNLPENQRGRKRKRLWVSGATLATVVLIGLNLYVYLVRT